MRTCPNGACRLIHEDSVGQCPECGASMARKPDEPRDPNMALYAARDRAMREAALERRLASRMSAGRGDEIDLGASPEVIDAGRDLAEDALAFVLGAMPDAA